MSQLHAIPGDRDLVCSTTSDFFLEPAYTRLEAKWLGGDAAGFDISSTHIPIVEMTFEDMLDAKSPYGYPFPRVEETALASLLLDVRREAAHRGYVTVFLRLAPADLPIEGHLGGPDDVGLQSEGVFISPGSPTFGVDLQAGDRLHYSKNTRRDLRRAEREGLTIRKSASGWPVRFAKIYAETMERLHAKEELRYGLEYFHQMDSELSDKILSLEVLAPNSSEVLAHGLFSVGGRESHYLLSASNFAHELRGYGTKLMLDTAIHDCSERGSGYLNLGGAPDGQAGLADLKRRFSNSTRVFRTVRMVIDDCKYQTLTTREPMNGYFPAYREPREEGAISGGH